MNKEVLWAIGILDDTIYNLRELIKIIENLNELFFLKKKFETILMDLRKRRNILEKIASYTRQVASFERLSEDAKRNWTYKVGKMETNFDELLNKCRLISVDAYTYSDIDFYFSDVYKLLIINKIIIFNTWRKTFEKNIYNKEDIINLILKK